MEEGRYTNPNIALKSIILVHQPKLNAEMQRPMAPKYFPNLPLKIKILLRLSILNAETQFRLLEQPKAIIYALVKHIYQKKDFFYWFKNKKIDYINTKTHL